MKNIFLLGYHEILWRPLFNGLVWFYTVLPFHDMGLAIIALTIGIRLIFAPLLWHSQKTQKTLARLQPELKKIQEEFKDKKEAHARATMELYAKHRINPFLGCLLLFIQLPVLIALFRVFRSGFDVSSLAYLYSFVHNPGLLNPIAFGLFDLTKGSIYLGILAALTQYAQARFMLTTPATLPKDGADVTQMLQWQSVYVFPLLVLASSASLPSALSLYWTVLNIFGIVQEIIMRRTYRHLS